MMLVDWPSACTFSLERPRLIRIRNLQKFHGCLRSQQELGKIRRLFKQPEITAQLEACEAELQGLLELFKVCYSTDH